MHLKYIERICVHTLYSTAIFMTNVICLLTQVHVRVQLCSYINCSELFRYVIFPACSLPCWICSSWLQLVCLNLFPLEVKLFVSWVPVCQERVSGLSHQTSICHRMSSDMYKSLIKNILITSQQRVSPFNVGSGISITFRSICPITRG